MPGVDFDRVRAEITMEQVLGLLGFQPSTRSGAQWYGSCPLHESTLGRRRSLVLCERGDRSLLLPSLPQPWQPARALGGRHEAAPVSSRGGPLPSPWPRRSLDPAMVRASLVIVRLENPYAAEKETRSGDDATGTLRSPRLDQPSIISIKGLSIIVITLIVPSFRVNSGILSMAW